MDDSDFRIGHGVPQTSYRIVCLLGEGGMGSVYEVEHSTLGKRFVLKALRGNLASRKDMAQRMRNEWRALGRLEHPNIVSVTDAGQTPKGTPYFVMERLQGETLAARLKSGPRFQIAEAIHVAVQVLDGLHAAHGIGVVHRDVKPPNIFLVEGGTVKLLDFGIAKTLAPDATHITGTGVAIGTPRYMAPEQASGASVDERTDLYAVGLVLFEMIAGRGPFDDTDNPNDLFLAHVGRPPPRLASLVPNVPAELDELLARVLAKKPTHRPESAAELAVALREVFGRLTSRPSSPPLPGWMHLAKDPSGPRFSVTSTLVVTPDGPMPSTQAPGSTRDTEAAAPPTGATNSPAREYTATRTYAGDDSVAGHPESFSNTVDSSEPETRTAAPAPDQQTAPPVSSGERTGEGPSMPTPRPRGPRRLLAAAGLAGLAAVGVYLGVTLRASSATSPDNVVISDTAASAPADERPDPVVAHPPAPEPEDDVDALEETGKGDETGRRGDDVVRPAPMAPAAPPRRAARTARAATATRTRSTSQSTANDTAASDNAEPPAPSAGDETKTRAAGDRQERSESFSVVDPWEGAQGAKVPSTGSGNVELPSSGL